MVAEIEAVLRESPVAAAIVAVVGLAFLLVLLAAITSGSRGRKRRRRAAAAARDEYDTPATEPDPAPAYVVPPPRIRRGFGLAALTIAFVVGLVGGMATMTTLRHDISAALSRLASLVATDPDAPGAPAVAPPGGGTTVAPSAELDARLAAFVTSLRASLPRPAGQELSLNSVEVSGIRIDLGYGIARIIPPDQVSAFQAYLDRTARSLFCGGEATEVRYLVRNGVSFHMTYTDPAGTVISAFTVTSAFCG